MCVRFDFFRFFFPFDSVGNRRRVVKFDTSNTPVISPNMQEFHVVWSGKFLDISYTQEITTGTNPDDIQTVYQQRRLQTQDGIEEYFYARHKIDGYNITRIFEHKIYFNCTNVTSLVVNGETLI